MVKPLEEKYIFDIVNAHLKAWQKAFTGILSESLLDELEIGDFIGNWKCVLDDESRTNLIYVNDLDRAIGFVSFGPPKETCDLFNHEIYGIYVHPDHWGKQIGYQLMCEAMDKIQTQEDFKGIFLWVMAGNAQSREFYEKFGFEATEETKTSSRYDEEFEEVKYIYLTNTSDG